MRTFLMLGSGLVLLAGVAMAQQPAKKPMAKHAAAPMAMKTHDLKVELVSLDAKAKKLVVKDESGKQQTVNLDATALTEAKAFKAGDKLTVTCRDNEKGEHLAITQIKPRKG